MENTELIGLAAAFCTTFSFVPQLVHTIKTKDTAGISLKMYSLFVLGVLLWLAYGLLLNSLPIILANVVTLVLSGSILYLKVRSLGKGKKGK